MEQKTKNAMALTFFLGIAGVALLIAAFATDNWVRSSPRRNITSTESNNTGVGGSSKYTGNITFGLFRGFRVLDYGVGPREAVIIVECSRSDGVCAWREDNQPYSLHDELTLHTNNTVKEDFINNNLFDYGLWVATIIMLALGIVWGLVSIGFTTFNLFGKPIETITGPMGLYLWNGLAFAFSLIGALVYVGLFVKDLSQNILPPDDINAGWLSRDRTWLDYSFYLVVGASAAFMLNNIVLVISGQKLACSYSRAAEKELDNGMILY